MSGAIRTLGVLTSGGDCAGLNAAICAVARAALGGPGWRTLGIFDGTLGLIADPPQFRALDPEALDRLPFRDGGTALGSISHGDPLHFRMPDGSARDRSEEFIAGVRRLGLDALVVIGGDGSMRILTELCARAGLPMLGIPKTIDNDVPGTDLAIGFSTAVQVVSDAIDRLQPTAASHHRAMILEVMGREAGHIALHGGVAGGADAILLPECASDLDALARHVRAVIEGPRRHALIVVAEGVPRAPGGDGAGAWLRAQLQARIGCEVRHTVLGHLQRGGSPNATDRLLASAFGVHAVELLARGQRDRMVAWRGGRVDSVPITRAVSGPRGVDADDRLLTVARSLGIHVGQPCALAPAAI